MQYYNPRLKLRSRELRNNMTDAELLLWSKLRGKKVRGLQFYRQKPILSFVVDFFCPKAGLVIEVDGGQHFEPVQEEKDKDRDRKLRSLGLRVLRFDNRQVLQETEAVMEKAQEQDMLLLAEKHYQFQIQLTIVMKKELL